MSETKLSSYQEEAFSQVFYDCRANYIGWFQLDDGETLDLPEDSLPIEELPSLLRSIRYEMTDEDWEWLKDTESIHIEDFKTLLAYKVGGPDEILGSAPPKRETSEVPYHENEGTSTPEDPVDDSEWWTNPATAWPDPIPDWGVIQYAAVETAH
ncbi:uncharacterized protein EI90DRAFT_3054785 [Cantharellus anzutake]|uniref:uncharacterized protein n=1 Tax=Cantharellus anzutake TaxID=1750568 RepID=UPI0019036CF9|nr:uncharacterized protein EI90DRAFT_3093069 [Cantharellus anzutake]XP_038916699.1 uncharacterized protein EI90DRAFT_3054785 [Cantharellus anzutake]KAF8312730.1 hypothetical protein EI90DRAFT_3093069 [Cantharellus anzutake]KAF8332256.1 hypothetical protein EI90DRAFT_3054785 [Cantharellus anzutake]